jgi:FMN phosphatase YigB (HAD superfamily)
LSSASQGTSRPISSTPKPPTTRAAGPGLPTGPASTVRSVRCAILWDFDGTVYRAPAACRRYAEEIALSLPRGKRSAYLERVDRYLAGEDGLEAADGWDAALRAALGEDDPSRRQEAFRRARAYLESRRCPVEVPAGLRATLERLRPACRQLLFTNTPAYGVFRLLQRLGLADLFDEVVCEAGKPACLPARLAAVRQIYCLSANAVLSVGDHFPNDIAPALAAGATTAYVDPFGVGPRGRATFESKSLEQLLPSIESWARAMASAPV